MSRMRLFFSPFFCEFNGYFASGEKVKKNYQNDDQLT